MVIAVDYSGRLFPFANLYPAQIRRIDLNAQCLSGDKQG
jgi:hypothetical protein